jgi:uncharacterized membrane protein YbhN (UPF0104 family)
MPLPLSEGARKGLLAVFGIALGLGLLWAALRNIDVDELRRMVGDIDPRWVVAGVAAYGAGIALRIVRWRSLLAQLVPTAPGYVGTYQYVFSLAMTAFGLAAVAGVVAATIVQVALYGGLTLLGITLYLLANLRAAVGVKAPVLGQPAE